MTYYTIEKKIMLKKNGKFVVSEGRARLLRKIKDNGSIALSAKELGMSYRHAWGIIKKINSAVGEKVVLSERGGRIGGKTVLTPIGLEILSEYENYTKRKPFITVDAIIPYNEKILLIKRKYEPYKGFFALPGGFVEYGETVEDAIIREVKEEVGVEVKIKALVGVYSNPNRDPRGHTITIAYLMSSPNKKFKIGNETLEVKLFSFEEIKKMKLAFDHKKILMDAFKLI
ncbi:MAG: NUDIX domain-containing protein [Candidatus Thermoplasmatota archaeon]